MRKKKADRGDGVYKASDRTGFVISWKDAEGRRKRRTVKVPTQEQARAALSAEKQKVEKAKAIGMPLPTEDSFAAFAAEFLRHQERRIAPRVTKGRISKAEYERQKGIVETKLVPFFGVVRLAAVRRPDVVRFINERTGQVSDATIIKEVNTLKRLFNVALALEKIPANPAQDAPLPQAPEGRNRYLTPEQWHDVFKACYIPHDADGNESEQWLQQAAALAISLGTRRGELLAVTVPDIDLDARMILLRRTKNGKERAAFINDLAKQVLISMGISERKQRKDRGKLFHGVTAEQISMRFIRACREAGVEDFSFHDLRHSYASHLRMAGADLHDLQILLGHKDPRMTARYAHLSDAHLAANAQRLNGVLTLPAPDSETTPDVQPEAIRTPQEPRQSHS
jgi:integrase